MIGILGGGQLGRMIALAGAPLGLRFRFLDPSPEAPAARLGELVCGDYHDPGLLPRFLEGLTQVTYEFENVPLGTARWLAARVPIYPPPCALEAAQDRVREKTLFQTLGIPTPEFQPVTSRQDFEAALARIGLPAVMKTCRFGYDGKGQRIITSEEGAEDAWRDLRGVPLILERCVPFTREVSLLAVRGLSGETAFYPLVDNEHRRGILRLSRAPAHDLPPGCQEKAQDFVSRLLERLQYVGVLAVEFFLVNDELCANEMAPRVHNSGHWTIEGAETSQFANHLHAILGWPLGSTKMHGHAAMLNILGTIPPVEPIVAMPGAYLHLYDKKPMPDRKLGHVTLVDPDPMALEARIREVKALLPVEPADNA